MLEEHNTEEPEESGTASEKDADDTSAEENESPTGGSGDGGGDEPHDTIHLSGMYKNWFLDYASYVILERAVPGIDDGLKPVQRRILHSLRELDDGRYNKVANLIGHTMKYHPHGDASIGDALVAVGQKELLIDTQGNWGNILTGDRAAAPRYIEARLTKFALDVVFNPKTTVWLSSYDGRSKEPEALPSKFPLLLAQGVEGIAVGLACKIMPHNFNELIDASIKALRGKKVDIVPDFPTAGMADFSQYNEGLRGGKVRVRAKLAQHDKKTLVITEIPFGSTTTSLIESIIKANDKGKIKIKKVEDNTAEHVEILIHLPASTSPDKTIDALYAFTDCENSISPNSCVIIDDRPAFISVNEILKISAGHTQDLLQKELEIRKSELENAWHYLSLEKIFIENRIYRDIEECETWEAVIKAIDKGLKPHVKKLKQPVTEEDIVKLTEIKIKRISKFDSDKADHSLKKIIDELKVVKEHLANIVDYAVEHFKDLKKKYGKGRERKTEIKSFENIVASKVAVANVKLYVNKEEGFAGYSMRKDEFVRDCSDIDNLIVFRGDGTMIVTSITSKAFVGKDIVHIDVFKNKDTRTIYNMIYQDGPRGSVMMKRFAVQGVTRDKEYILTKGKEGSKVLYFTANPNGESEVVQVNLRPKPKLKKTRIDLDFGALAIKGRGAGGNILTKNAVSKVVQKERGVSTLGARKIWFDDSVQRLNADERGDFLGEFSGNDKILTIMQSGDYQLYPYSLSTHFEEDMILIEKWNPHKAISAIYYDGDKKQYYVKRFDAETAGRKVPFITEHEDSFLERAVVDKYPIVELAFAKVKGIARANEQINLHEFIAVKGVKALGNRLSQQKVKGIEFLDPLEDDTDYEALAAPEELEGVEMVEEDAENAIEEAEVEDELAEAVEDGDAQPEAKEPARTTDIDQSGEEDVKTETPKKEEKPAPAGKQVLKKSKGDDDESQIKLDL
ncbi:MAG: DNA gyrase/topoisomerase IV subunit A [Flavobacteriales bacterium]|nr:DNA gyrase/topoisomerase IV subunit A [Flavobacteriales bacterium]